MSHYHSNIPLDNLEVSPFAMKSVTAAHRTSDGTRARGKLMRILNKIRFALKSLRNRDRFESDMNAEIADCYIPARRAAHVDPILALRQE